MRNVGLARLLLVLSVAAGLAHAQRRTVWDGVYTETQAARGEMSFGRSCANCHVLATEGKIPLVGDLFWKSFSQKTVGELLQYVSTNMPNGAPHSLSDEVYADIAAAMLRSNGFPAGATELTPNTVADVQIIPTDGSTKLPANALVRVIGCLSRSGSDWIVTSATDPVRAEQSEAGEATRSLGTRTMQLKFVLTKLDSLAGSRVAVNGLLIGADGADGINVTAVNRVAPKCN